MAASAPAAYVGAPRMQHLRRAAHSAPHQPQPQPPCPPQQRPHSRPQQAVQQPQQQQQPYQSRLLDDTALHDGSADCRPSHQHMQQPLPPRLQPPPQQPQQPPADSIEDLFEDLEQVDFPPLAPAASAARAVADAAVDASADVSPSCDGAELLADSSEEPAADSGGSDEGDGDQATELIFRLERRGDGWAEEIFPHITVENRPLEKKQRIRPRSNQPDPWEVRPASSCILIDIMCALPLHVDHRIDAETGRVISSQWTECLASCRQSPIPSHEYVQEGSLEEFLAELGVPHEKVDETVQAAIVWRVTPAGRPLIDRRRRSRVERNVRSVTDHLIQECGLSKGELPV